MADKVYLLGGNGGGSTGGGSGDMTKAVYDTDDDGTVDSADTSAALTGSQASEITANSGHKTTEDAINGLVKVNGSGTYSAVTDSSSNWNSAYSHISLTNNPHSVTKAQVNLTNVEDTALSTWAGTSSITTVGTVSSGNVDSAVSSSSVTVAGKIEIATSAETTTGTDATRAVSPDGLAGSDYGKRAIALLAFDDSEDVETGDGAGDLFWRVPAILNGYNLVSVAAQVQTAGTTGTTDIQVYNVTQTADMLSTKITIDSTEVDSSTAATPAVIDTANDDVTTADQIRIDVDAVSTTAPKGLLIELTFQQA